MSVADSEPLQEMYALTESVPALGKKAYFFMVVPPWVRDGLRGHDRLHYVHVETTRDEDVNDVVGYSALDLSTLFARRGGRYIVDAVVTDCVQFSLQLGRMLSDPFKDRIPVIVRDLRRTYKNRDEVEDNASIALGYSANHFAYTTQGHKQAVVEFLKTYLQPSLLRKFDGRAFRWPLSIDLRRIDKIVSSAKKRDRITALFSADPAQRHSKLIFSAYRQLYAMGTEVIVSTRSSRAMLKRSLPDDDTSYLIEINCGIGYDSYLAEVAKCHLFVSVAEDEDAVYEDVRRILLGEVGVFPFVPAVTTVLGNDYPLLYNPWKEGEAVTLAKWVVDHYEEALEITAGARERLRSEFDRVKVMGLTWENIEKVIDSRYRQHEFKVEDAQKMSLSTAVKHVSSRLGDEFSLQVFLDILEEHATWLKPWGHKGTLQTLGRVRESLPTMYDLREMLDNLGWTDTCVGHEPMMKR